MTEHHVAPGTPIPAPTDQYQRPDMRLDPPVDGRGNNHEHGDRDAGLVRLTTELTEDEKATISLYLRECHNCRQGVTDVEPCECQPWFTGIEKVLSARLAVMDDDLRYARADAIHWHTGWKRTQEELARLHVTAESRLDAIKARNVMAEKPAPAESAGLSDILREHFPRSTPWNREQAQGAIDAALAARQSDTDATERVEWGVRWSDGYVRPEHDEATAREIASYNTGLARVAVRRTVTTGEWTEVGE